MQVPAIPTSLSSLFGCTKVQNGAQTWDKTKKPNGCKRGKQSESVKKEEIQKWKIKVKETKGKWKDVRQERIKSGYEGRKEQKSGKKYEILKCAIRSNMFVSITFARLYRPAQWFVAAYIGHKCVKHKVWILKFCICLWTRYLGNKILQIPPHPITSWL